MSEAAAPAATWYDDPHDPSQLRWWDGSQWTEHVAPRPTPEPVQLPPLQVAAPPAQVATPVPSSMVTATPSETAKASSAPGPASIGRSIPRPTTRTLAALGAAIVVIVAAVVLLHTTRGDGAGTADAAGTASAPAGPPLTPAEYAAELRTIMAPLDDMDVKMSSDAAEQAAAMATLKAAVPLAREAQSKLAAVSPPTAIQAEHTVLVGQFGQFVDGIEKLVASPNDQEAGGAVLGAGMGLFGTMTSIESKLGIKLELE